MTVGTTGEGVYGVDLQGRFTFVSAAGVGMLGYDHEDELLGRAVHELIHEPRPDATCCPVEACGILAAPGDDRGVSRDDERLFRRDGSSFPALRRARPIREDGRIVGSVCTFTDITPRRVAAASPGGSAEQAALLDEARDAMMVRDLDHRIVYWNRSAERLYGWSREQAIGRPTRTLLYDDPAVFDRAVALLLAEGAWSGELTQVAMDGSEIVVAAHWTLVRDEEGEPCTVLAVDSDLTERRRIEQQLLRAQRTDSIGTLASGIAHDLNNALAPILLAVQTLQLGEHDAATDRLLELIEQSTVRGADMVRHVLSFARGVTGRRDDVDLDALLSEVAGIACDTFPKNVRIELTSHAGTWPVVGDVTQLHQVMMNLCINARDAMPEGGTLGIGVGNATRDADDHVVVWVEDEGTGMDLATLERIFDPFFTTKGAGSGTGLGLSTSQGIVTSHGGTIEVTSEVGVGSRFELYLPVAEAGEPAGEQVGPCELPRGRGELVLIVDDEVAVRQVVRKMLESCGYRVIEAENGLQALLEFDRRSDDIAIVLTDLMMPNLDGQATIRELRSRCSALPIVVASGLTPDEELAEFGIDHVLTKPYSVQSLLQALDEARPRAVSARPPREVRRPVAPGEPASTDAGRYRSAI